MDGKQLTQAVLDRAQDNNAAAWATDRRRIFEALDQTCAVFCRELRTFQGTAVLTTVEGQQDYDLPPDFIDTALATRAGRPLIKYAAGTNLHWPRLATYDEIFRLALTDSQEVPSRICVRDKETDTAPITGAAEATISRVYGLSVLEDTTKAFTTTDRVWPRDVIHNENDRSDGYVVEVMDATHLRCALFDGKKNYFSNSDAYIISPASQMQLTLEAPAATAGHILTIPYFGLPNPVYSDYGAWRMEDRICRGIAWGAAALLELPDMSFEEAKVMNGQFMEEIRRTKIEIARAALRSTRRR